MTTPRVTIASAVATSCAAIGVAGQRTLVEGPCKQITQIVGFSIGTQIER